jgi:hypothetical protein
MFIKKNFSLEEKKGNFVTKRHNVTGSRSGSRDVSCCTRSRSVVFSVFVLSRGAHLPLHLFNLRRTGLVPQSDAKEGALQLASASSRRLRAGWLSEFY